MDDRNPRPEDELAAGEFGSWLAGLQRARQGEADSDVPCGTCTACCTSGQFVHVEPDEADTLAHIPRALLFPAPGLPRGHVLLGYDERGHCPMLVDGGCSIYAHRPRTCRTYDCRVFPATGLDPRSDGKPAIAARARRWRFTYAGDEVRRHHEAARVAADYLRDRADELPPGAVPPMATPLAVLALDLHDAFLGEGADGATVVITPDLGVVAVELRRRSR